MPTGNESDKIESYKPFSENVEFPQIPSTLYNKLTTNFKTPNASKSLIYKGTIIGILRNSGDNFQIFIPYIRKYKLSEDVIKKMKIENYERVETKFENIFFLIEKIPKKKHNKFCIDNIMKKVRVHFIKYLVSSTNIFLENEGLKNIKLAKIDYEFKCELKRKDNLENLDSPIKDLLSANEKNKKIIEDILAIQNKNEKINIALNLSFREWIYIFTMEKEPPMEGIKFDGFYSFLKEILDKNANEGNYFYTFIFCVYNFEIWFNCKKKRNQKNRSKKKK